MPDNPQYPVMPAPAPVPAQNTDLQYGPFTPYLSMTPQMQQAPAQPSGFGGKAENLAVFASRFLQGLQQGRRQAFERNELAKARHMETFRSLYEAINNSPWISPEDKDRAGQLFASATAGAAHDAIAQAEQGQGGGKGGGKGKQGQGGNPLIGFAKQIFGGLAGPAQDKSSRDITTNEIGQMYSIFAHAKKIMPTEISAQVSQKFKQIVDAAQVEAQKRGIPLDRETILGLPGVVQLRAQLAQQGLDSQQYLDPLMQPYLGRVEQATLAREKALTASTEQATKQAAEGFREPYVIVTQDPQGRITGRQTVDRNSVSGKFYEPGTDKQVTPAPNSMAVPSTAALYSSTLSAETQKERIAMTQKPFVDAGTGFVYKTDPQGKMIQLFGPDGKPLKGDSALSRVLLQQGGANRRAAIAERDRILGQYGALVGKRGQIAARSTRTPQDRARVEQALKEVDAEIERLRPTVDLIQENFAGGSEEKGSTQKGTAKPKATKESNPVSPSKAFEMMTEPVSSGTSRPPSAGTATPPAATPEAEADQFLQGR